MDLPVINVDVYRSQAHDSAAVVAECGKAAASLIRYGALVLHDSRVTEGDNEAFLDLLEDYFAQAEEDLQEDARPELGYQVGVTLEKTERPRCAVDDACLDLINRLAPDQRPLDISAHLPDPKCRFFWRMADKPPPYESAFPALNADNVVPRAPQIRERWAPTMDQWGRSMKNAVSCLAEMAALGLGLAPATFTDAGRYGPHVLAPTASNLHKYGNLDTILAGFHTDLNFLTIHGRSRYPGLHIWARNTGRRIPVKIPAGNHLLVQAGKQLEHLTGGLIKAGYHEVVVNKSTVETMGKRKDRFPDRPLVRISSTFFWHLSSDFELRPIPELADRATRSRLDQRNLNSDEGAQVQYPTIKVGHQVQSELKYIALMES